MFAFFDILEQGELLLGKTFSGYKLLEKQTQRKKTKNKNKDK